MLHRHTPSGVAPGGGFVVSMLKAEEVAAISESLRRLLAVVESGEMTATAATRYRLEGALAALEAVTGDPSTLLDKLGIAVKDRLV